MQRGDQHIIPASLGFYRIIIARAHAHKALAERGKWLDEQDRAIWPNPFIYRTSIIGWAVGFLGDEEITSGRMNALKRAIQAVVPVMVHDAMKEDDTDYLCGTLCPDGSVQDCSDTSWHDTTLDFVLYAARNRP